MAGGASWKGHGRRPGVSRVAHRPVAIAATDNALQEPELAAGIGLHEAPAVLLGRGLRGSAGRGAHDGHFEWRGGRRCIEERARLLARAACRARRTGRTPAAGARAWSSFRVACARGG